MDVKVTNEIEKERTRNAVTLLVVLVVGLLIIVGLVIMLKIKLDQNEKNLFNYTDLNNNGHIQNTQNNNEKNKVDFEELTKELYNKENIALLPELTDQERISYEKEWKESLTEMIKENEKLIKKKYPEVSDSEARTYAIQFTEYIKEDMFRILKNNRDIKEKAENAVDNSELADARAHLALKYAQLLSEYYIKYPGQEYKANESDLKALQQYVLEKTDGKYTVKINQDNKGYDIEKITN